MLKVKMAKITNIIDKRLRETFSQIDPLIRQKIKTGEINEAQGDRIKVVLDIFKDELIENIEEILSDKSIYDFIDLINEDDPSDLESLLVQSYDDAA
jgi:hypothetical protein